MSMVRTLALVAILVLTLAACTEETRDAIGDAVETELAEGGGGDTESGDTESAGGDGATGEGGAGDSGDLPDITLEITLPEDGSESEAAADPEPAEDEGLSSDTILLGVIALGLLVIILIAARRKPEQVTQRVEASAPPADPAPSGPTWREQAGRTFADARWISDSADTDLAKWIASNPDLVASDTSRMGSTAREVDARINRTLNQSYRLESGAENEMQRDAAHLLADALKTVRSAFEADVAAHRNASADPSAVSAADAQLSDASNHLLAALDELTAVG